MIIKNDYMDYKICIFSHCIQQQSLVQLTWRNKLSSNKYNVYTSSSPNVILRLQVKKKSSYKISQGRLEVCRKREER